MVGVRNRTGFPTKIKKCVFGENKNSGKICWLVGWLVVKIKILKFEPLFLLLLSSSVVAVVVLEMLLLHFPFLYLLDGKS